MWICLLAEGVWLWHWPLWQWMAVSSAWKALFLHMLTLPVCLCASVNLFFPLCLSTLTLPPTGRVSLTHGASLLVERLTLEDEGWFECRILLLDSKTDNFQNGTWTFLSITGAALQGVGNMGAASFVTRRWFRLYLERLQHGVWLYSEGPGKKEIAEH